MKKQNLYLAKRFLSILMILSCVICFTACANISSNGTKDATNKTEESTACTEEENYNDVPALKPVIYLYPEHVTDVSVKLDYFGKLTCTYPAYKDGWQVTANPDSTLTDADGQTYNYLYWEGINYFECDFSKGFCVAGDETAAFLEDALNQLGLTRKEANEFIVYWLPRMQENPYNLISFQTDIYTQAAKLIIDPAPDTMIRVFMACKPLDSKIDIPTQELTTVPRTGFTVIEWGGSLVK